MDNSSAEDDECEDDYMYARYVKVCDVLSRASLYMLVLIVRPARCETALGFKGGYAGA